MVSPFMDADLQGVEMYGSIIFTTVQSCAAH